LPETKENLQQGGNHLPKSASKKGGTSPSLVKNEPEARGGKGFWGRGTRGNQPLEEMNKREMYSSPIPEQLLESEVGLPKKE